MSRKAIVTIVAAVIAVLIIGVLAISSNSNNAEKKTGAQASTNSVQLSDQ